ncbi:MAG: RHS repeat protein, partial [bacterium]|nr:RHS repeat protein [bacterium]
GIVRGLELYEDALKNKRLAVVGGGDFANGYLQILDVRTEVDANTNASRLVLEELKSIHISKKWDAVSTVSYTLSGWKPWPILGGWSTKWNATTVEVFDTGGTVGGWVSGKPRDIQVVGNLGFIAINGGGVLAVNMDLAVTETDWRRACLPVYMEDPNIVEVRPYITYDAEGEQRVMVAALVENFGIKILDVSVFGESDICIGQYETDGNAMGGIDVAAGYEVDENGDGIYQPFEKKDLLFFTTAAGSTLQVLDISTPAAPTVYRTIVMATAEVPDISGMVDLEINESSKTLYISSGAGLITMDAAFSRDDDIQVDTGGDRILSIVKTANAAGKGLAVNTDLDIAYVGKGNKGLDVVKLRNPEIRFMYLDATNEYREIDKIAPSGLKETDNPISPLTGEVRPHIIYLKVNLPGGMGAEVKARLQALNEERAPVFPWGEKVKTDDTVLLRRMSDNRDADTYNHYISEPVVITLKPDETLGSKRVLSGNWMRASFDTADAASRAKLAYLSDANLAAVQSLKQSIPAMYIDSEKPNPALNSSIGPNVYLHSGEFFHAESDMAVPGRGFGFIFSRYYDSQSLYSGPLGWSWNHNFNIRLVELYNGDMLYFDGYGRRERYKAKKKGDMITGYESPKGYFTRLKRTSRGQYWLKSPQGSNQVFNQVGRLVMLRDRYGNKMVLTYDHHGRLVMVTDSLKRNYLFAYYPDVPGSVKSGRLKSITDFNKSHIDYDYDANGDLLTVTKGARVRTYGYQTIKDDVKLSHNLNSIKDAENVEYLKVIYDGDDKATGVTVGTDTITVAVAGKTAVVTDSRNISATYKHDDDGHATDIILDGKASTFTYDSEGRLTSAAAPLGNKVEYEYDVNNTYRRMQGNVLFVRSIPHGSNDKTLVTEYRYAPLFSIANYVKGPRGFETKMTISSKGNVDRVTYPDTTSSSYSYNSYGQLTLVTNPGNSTKYEYHPATAGHQEGYLRKVTVEPGKEDITTEYEYNVYGQVVKTTDGEGGESTFDYPAPYYQLKTATQGTKSVTTAAGVQQPAVNLTTTYTYYKTGLLETAGQNGVTTTYTYDTAHRTATVVSAAGALNQMVSYTYDKSGNLHTIKDPKKNTTTLTYNTGNQLMQKIAPNSLGTIGYEYTANGQIFKVTDAVQKTYTYRYDGHGRTKEIEDPLGNIVSYGLDENSNLKTMEAVGTDGTSFRMENEYNNLDQLKLNKVKTAGGFNVTTPGYNDDGMMTSVTNPNNHTYTMTPYGSGLPKTMQDPVGNVVDSKHDKRGLQYSVDFIESPNQAKNDGRIFNQTFNHGVMGELRGTGDTISRDYTPDYNAKLQQTSLSGPESKFITYEYDAMGRLWKVHRNIHYDGKATRHTIIYGYDANGNLESVKDPLQNETTYGYDAKNRLTSITYPGAVSNSITYYANDVIDTYRDFNGTVVKNTLDGAGRIGERTITHATGVEGTTYEKIIYDGLGRLKSIEDDDSMVEYTYNQEGLPVTETIKYMAPQLDENGAVDTDENEKIVMVAAHTYVVESRYDANGNRTKLVYPSYVNPAEAASGKLEVTYTPDALDRIDTITSGAAVFADYDYEGVGKVSSKKLSNSAIEMLKAYDPGGRPTTLTYQTVSGKLFDFGMDWTLL